MIEPTYQWSLEYYIDLFIAAIAESRKIKSGNRCDDIINTHQLSLYDSICRALLEKDKLIYSLLMCIKILESENLISLIETRLLMVGGTWTESEKPQGKSKEWLPEKSWFSVCEFS